MIYETTLFGVTDEEPEPPPDTFAHENPAWASSPSKSGDDDVEEINEKEKSPNAIFFKDPSDDEEEEWFDDDMINEHILKD